MFDPALNTLISHPCLEQHRPDVVAGLVTLTQRQPATSRFDGSKLAEQTDQSYSYVWKITPKSKQLKATLWFQPFTFKLFLWCEFPGYVLM